MKMDFFGSKALVVGGTCELALALAPKMAAAGIYPLLTHRNPAGARHIDEKMANATGPYGSLELDLADASSVNRLVTDTSWGADYLVDFAQGDYEHLVAGARGEDTATYFQTNVSARSRIIKAAARHMLKKRRGRMVFVSSLAAKLPNPGQGFYAAAKRASEALYKNAALELAGRGITTVTLRPGYVEAGRGRNYLEKKQEEALQKVPLGRALRAEEVADAILFLLSDNAAGFNGTALTMDGGLSTGK